MLSIGEKLILGAALLGATVTVRIMFLLEPMAHERDEAASALQSVDALETTIPIPSAETPTNVRTAWKPSFETYEQFAAEHVRRVLSATKELKKGLAQ